MESETEDGKIRTEGQLKREVINGVGSLLAYYRYVQNYPDNEKDIQPLKTTKNMILYGPPGTGKTYTTAAYAMSVCDRFYTLDVLKELITARSWKDTMNWNRKEESALPLFISLTDMRIS